LKEDAVPANYSTPSLTFRVLVAILPYGGRLKVAQVFSTLVSRGHAMLAGLVEIRAILDHHRWRDGRHVEKVDRITGMSSIWTVDIVHGKGASTTATSA